MNNQHVENALEMWAKLKGYEVCHDSECYFVNNGWHYHIDIDNLKYAPKIDYTFLYEIINGLDDEAQEKYLKSLYVVLEPVATWAYINIHTATVEQILEALYEAKP